MCRRRSVAAAAASAAACLACLLLRVDRGSAFAPAPRSLPGRCTAAALSSPATSLGVRARRRKRRKRKKKRILHGSGDYYEVEEESIDCVGMDCYVLERDGLDPLQDLVKSIDKEYSVEEEKLNLSFWDVLSEFVIQNSPWALGPSLVALALEGILTSSRPP